MSPGKTVLGLSILLAWPLFAQQDQGVIIGTVFDLSRGAIPGAVVLARETKTNLVARTETNGNGVYFLGPLKTGTYDVSVRADGFKEAVRNAIRVHPNDRIGLDFVLEVGSLLEVVEVPGATPLLETQSASLEHVVDRRSIEQLPLVDRNYQVLAKLAAGVLPEIGGRDRGPLLRGGTLSSGFTSHGQPALQNNYLIDGVDNNTTLMGLQDRKAQVVVPSLEAIEEFKIQTSNYSAEFGRNAGAVINVSTRRGTNEFHGSVYEFLRNDALDARPAFGYTDRDGDGKADPAALRQSMFGAALGGPVIRNRMFFFASMEGWRVRSGQTDRAVVPTPLEKAGDFSETRGLRRLKDPLGGQFPGRRIPASRIDPVMLKLLTLYPEPNYQDPATRDNYLSHPPWRIDRNQFDFRLDHTLSERDMAFGRYSFYRFHSLRAGPLPGLARGGIGNDRALDDNRGQHLTLSETHVFGLSLINEVRLGYKSLRAYKRNSSDVPLAEANARFGIRGVPPTPGIFGLTRFLFAGRLGYQGLGGAMFQPNLKGASTVQILDNFTWLRGNHALKFGADIRYDRSDIDGSQWSRGEYQFNGRFTGVSLGDALLGWANRVRLSNRVFGEMRFQSYMFFVQDDWKLSRTLTVNLGVRYELTTPWYEKNDRLNMTVIDPSSPDFGRIIRAGELGGGYEGRGLARLDVNNAAPRVGVAWRFRPHMVLRAGAGIFYGGEMALGASTRTLRNYPFTSSIERRASRRVPAQVLRDGFPSDFLGPETPLVRTVNDLPDDSTHRTWDWNYPRPQTHQWNVSLQREFTSQMALTVAYVGSGTQNISYNYDINAAGIGDPATEKQRRLIPRLSQLNFRSALAHSTYHGLDVTLERRFASGVGFTVAYTWGHNIGQAPDQFVGGDNAAPQDIRCISCEKGNSSSDVRHRLVASYIVDLPFGEGHRFLNRGGWLEALCGGWVFSGWISAQTGMYFTPQLPNASARLGTGGVGIWRPDLVGDWRLDNPGPDGWFNVQAFVRPCDKRGCRFGNLGRNTIQEPGMFEWTAALAKRWRLGERLRLDFRCEVLNLLNHPNYGTPNRTLGSPEAGKIRATHGQPRQVQLGLRLSF